MGKMHNDSSDPRSKRPQRRGSPKPKFVEQRNEEVQAIPLRPLNEKQRKYIDSIENHAMVVATGWAGTSKTYIPTVLACQKLRTHQIDKIVFTRPNISNSKSLGFFGGDLIEKMQNWLMPVMNILREQFNEETLEIYLKRGQIEFVPMEVVKGYSAENCFFIVDEAEDLTIDEAKKIVTRQGKGCKMVLCGDIFQSELGAKSGLAWIAEMVKKYSNLNTGLIEFDHVNDIVRSDTCRNWIIALRKEGHFNK